MAVTQTQRFCKTCQKPTLHARHYTGAAVGCLVAVLIGLILFFAVGALGFALCIGLWFLGAVLETLTSPYRCQQCGQGKMSFVQTLALVSILSFAGLAGIGLLTMKQDLRRPNSRPAPPAAAAAQIPPIAQVNEINPLRVEANAPQAALQPAAAAQIPPADPAAPAKVAAAAKEPDWQPTLGTVCWIKPTVKAAGLLAHPRYAAEFNTALKDLKQGGEGADSSMKLMIEREVLWLVQGGTRVRVVDQATIDRHYLMVEVLDGDMKGQRGWTVPKELVPTHPDPGVPEQPLPPNMTVDAAKAAYRDIAGQLARQRSKLYPGNKNRAMALAARDMARLKSELMARYSLSQAELQVLIACGKANQWDTGTAKPAKKAADDRVEQMRP